MSVSASGSAAKEALTSWKAAFLVAAGKDCSDVEEFFVTTRDSCASALGPRAMTIKNSAVKKVQVYCLLYRVRLWLLTLSRSFPPGFAYLPTTHSSSPDNRFGDMVRTDLYQGSVDKLAPGRTRSNARCVLIKY
jgi:hypothetical protein